jgi:hypothetical protein
MAAASGCGICSQVLDVLLARKHKIRHYTESLIGPFLKWKILDHLFNCFLVSLLSTDELEPLHNGMWNIDQEFDATGSIYHQNLLCETTEDPEVLTQGASWLSSCVNHHSTCGDEVDLSYHPPRILRISNDSVTLLDTGNVKPVRNICYT